MRYHKMIFRSIFYFIRFTGILMFVVIMGCTTPLSSTLSRPVKIYKELPEVDITLNIAGLGPCNNSKNRAFSLNSKEPVTILVHGCFGSAGRFLSLAEVLAFHGQQSVCFSYDERDSMMYIPANLLLRSSSLCCTQAHRR